MNYRLEYISEDDFEKLVNMLCHEILGCGVIELGTDTLITQGFQNRLVEITNKNLRI